MEFYLCRLDGFSQPLKTYLIVIFIELPRFILSSSKVLNLLTAVFDFCEAKGGRRAFEEVTEGGELCKIFVDAVDAC
jgi:hypothetical protein